MVDDSLLEGPWGDNVGEHAVCVDDLRLQLEADPDRFTFVPDPGMFSDEPFLLEGSPDPCAAANDALADESQDVLPHACAAANDALADETEEVIPSACAAANDELAVVPEADVPELDMFSDVPCVLASSLDACAHDELTVKPEEVVPSASFFEIK